ncbi:MAG: tetratricopeptide repeat protein [Spirochaetota bacterium]
MRNAVITAIFLLALISAGFCDENNPFVKEVRRRITTATGKDALDYISKNLWTQTLGITETEWYYHRGVANLVAYRQTNPPRTVSSFIQQAEKDLVIAKEYRGDDPSSYRIRARMYLSAIYALELGRPQDADAYIQEVERSIGDTHEYYLTVAFWRLYLGNVTADEEERYREAITHAGANATVLDYRVTMFVNAKKIFAEIRPRESVKGIAALEFTRDPGTISVLPIQREIELNADPVRRYLDLALLALAQGRYEQADQNAQLAYAKKHEAECYYVFGRYAYNRGDMRSAEENYRLCVSMKPDFAPCQFWYGVYCYGLKRFDDAVSSFEAAVKLVANNDTYFMNLATAYVAKRDMGKAEAAYKKAELISPMHPLLLRNIGTFYVKYKPNKVFAETYYKKYLAVSPNAPDRNIVRTWLDRLH